MSAVTPFDFDSLREQIVVAAEAAYAEISAREAPEPIVAFALYSDGGAMTVCPAMATATYLRATADDEEAMYFKYSPSEWPLEGIGARELFGPICDRVRNHVLALEAPASDDDAAGDGAAGDDALDSEFVHFQQRLMQTCVESAERLRAGCFAALGEAFIVLVTVSDDDEPAQVLNERVARLNSAAITQEFQAWSATWAS